MSSPLKALMKIADALSPEQVASAKSNLFNAETAPDRPRARWMPGDVPIHTPRRAEAIAPLIAPYPAPEAPRGVRELAIAPAVKAMNDYTAGAREAFPAQAQRMARTGNDLLRPFTPMISGALGAGRAMGAVPYPAPGGSAPHPDAITRSQAVRANIERKQRMAQPPPQPRADWTGPVRSSPLADLRNMYNDKG